MGRKLQLGAPEAGLQMVFMAAPTQEVACGSVLGLLAARQFSVSNRLRESLSSALLWMCVPPEGSRQNAHQKSQARTLPAAPAEAPWLYHRQSGA